MKKVIVTGGAGFIGSHLVDKLVSMGVQVTIIDDFSTGKRENINPAAYCWEQDISTVDIKTLTQYMKGIDVVFHLAAKTAVQESMDNPILYNKVNAEGTLKLLEASLKGGVKKFIFSSSSSVYGDAKVPTDEKHELNPMSHYAQTKMFGEGYCQIYSYLHKLDTACLRYFNVYGDRMSNEGGYKLVFSVWKEQLKNGKPLTINNDGKQRRDFVHVDDVVEANILAANDYSPLRNIQEIYNVGSGYNLSINKIADMFGGKKVYGNKVIEPFETLAQTRKIMNELNWKPKGNLEDWICSIL
jgi:UDP-glucose 4-epimerase